MARLTDTQTRALGNFWSDVAYIAAHDGTVTDAVAVASFHAGLFGETLSFADAQAVAVLAGYAVRLENAASVFRGADYSDPIVADMIGTPPWARDQQVMNTDPIWHATFEMTFTDSEGNTRTEFRTSVFEMTLPGTVGELTADILDDAEAMAKKYDITLLSVVPHSLVAVLPMIQTLGTALIWTILLFVYGAFVAVALRLIPTFGTPSHEFAWPRTMRRYWYRGKHCAE